MTKPLTIQVFRTGFHAGREWSHKDLETMAENFVRLKDHVRVNLKLGHSTNQILAGQDDGDPSLGTVRSVRKSGDALLCDVVGMPEALRQMVRRGNYNSVSIEAWPDFAQTVFAQNMPNAPKGPALAALALLGADRPAVKGLDALNKWLASEATALRLVASEPADGAVVVTMTCARPAETETETKLTMLEERCREVDADLARLAEAQAAIADRHRRMEKLTMTSLAPADAEDAGSIAHCWLADLDALIQRKAADPTNEDARRDAARELLLTWEKTGRELPEPRDFEASIRARSGDLSDLPGIGRPPAVSRGDGRRPATTSRGADTRPPVSSKARDRTSWGVPVPHSEADGMVELYGADARMAEDLSGVAGYGEGVARWHTLKALAKAQGLRLDRRGSREAALRLLYERMNPTADVSRAATFEEAVHCIEKQKKLSLTEAVAQHADVTREVARRRPDLLVDYRAGRDEPAPARRPRDPEEAADALDREARILLREQDTPATPAAMTRARKAVLAADPTLAPEQYGNRGRRWD